LPAVRDGAGKDLFGRPVVRGGRVGRRRDGNVRFRLLLWTCGLLLCGRRKSSGSESEAECNFIYWAHDSSFSLGLVRGAVVVVVVTRVAVVIVVAAASAVAHAVIVGTVVIVVVLRGRGNNAGRDQERSN